jgi:hypothetical protein
VERGHVFRQLRRGTAQLQARQIERLGIERGIANEQEVAVAYCA